MSRRTSAERSGPWLRLMRAGLLAGATLAVAVVAHASADGNLPSEGGLFWIWLLATLTVAPMLGRPASTRRIVVLLCAGQAAIHLLLTVIAGHGPPPQRSAEATQFATTSMLGPHAHAPGTPAVHSHAASGTGASDVFGHLLGELTSLDGLIMTASHLAGAAVVGLWLATGEKILWHCLREVARLCALQVGAALIFLRRFLTLVVSGLRGLSPVARPAGWSDAPPGPMLQRVLSPAPRRGPPVPVRPFACQF